MLILPRGRSRLSDLVLEERPGRTCDGVRYVFVDPASRCRAANMQTEGVPRAFQVDAGKISLARL